MPPYSANTSIPRVAEASMAISTAAAASPSQYPCTEPAVAVAVAASASTREHEHEHESRDESILVGASQHDGDQHADAEDDPPDGHKQATGATIRISVLRHTGSPLFVECAELIPSYRIGGAGGSLNLLALLDVVA